MFLLINEKITMFEDTIKKFLKREIKQFDDSQDETNNPINYFRRSRIHWLYLLNILNAFYANEVITKSDLIHKIQVSHITILKYIQETISLGIITQERSSQDRRKVILKPSHELILAFEEFFYEETRVLKNLFDERQQD